MTDAHVTMIFTDLNLHTLHILNFSFFFFLNFYGFNLWYAPVKNELLKHYFSRLQLRMNF
jgi:hypothetical protein